MAVWRRQGWPMQAMGFAQWELLRTMLTACAGGPDSFAIGVPQAQDVFVAYGSSSCGPPRPESFSKQVFPGGVLAEASDLGLRLVRPASDPEPHGPGLAYRVNLASTQNRFKNKSTSNSTTAAKSHSRQCKTVAGTVRPDGENNSAGRGS